MSMDGWDWLWMSFMTAFWLVLLGAVVYVAFALIDHGKGLWYRDYWLPPDRTMYVDPEKVLADIPQA